MRCGCSQCGAFMVHAENGKECVCPDCGNRCSACLGTDTVVPREQLGALLQRGWIEEDLQREARALENREEDARDGW